jgi:small subunit ribosomal protein S20
VANHKSALKAHRQNVVHREHNRTLRTRLRSTLKSVRANLDGGNASEVKSDWNATASLIDRMASKGVIHPNAAARHKSRLAKRLNAPKSQGGQG